MGLSLEGFGQEFEIGKIAFELEDLKKDKEKRREKIGDFSFLETNLGLEGWYIYMWEKEKKKEEQHVLESREGGGGRKNKQKEDFYLGIVFRRKRKDSQQPSHCNQS